MDSQSLKHKDVKVDIYKANRKKKKAGQQLENHQQKQKFPFTFSCHQTLKPKIAIMPAPDGERMVRLPSAETEWSTQTVI